MTKEIFLSPFTVTILRFTFFLHLKATDLKEDFIIAFL